MRTKGIKLSNGGVTLVDAEDYERLQLGDWKWKRHTQGYACRTGWKDGKFTCVLLHRVITDAPTGMEVDHLNGDKLDNRRHNLRVVEPLEHRMKHIAPLIQSAKGRQQYPDLKVCVACGSEFTCNPRKRKRQKCCSPECAQGMRVRAALAARGLA